MEKQCFLANSIDALGITLSETQIEQFLRYYELLVEWNAKMNLTSITAYEDVVVKHFLDSLAVVHAYDFQDGQRLIDVGTGAGFPGVPLKIVFPEMRVTLMDSLQKRIHFLEEVVTTLGLEDVDCIHARAEDLARDPQHRQQYDLCTSRAVAHLAGLSEYCLPFVKTGGVFISYKSKDVQDELAEAKHAIYLLGGDVKECCSGSLPGTDIERTWIIIEKKRGCPKQYPRKAGMPTKSPLS